MPKSLDGYYQDDKGLYWCKTCNGPIMESQVAHPIWDGPFPCSGRGRVEYETVPYCQKCEEKPNFHSSPITKEKK